MKLAPWEYTFLPFSPKVFPDLFDLTWIASLVLLTVLVVLYNVRTRQLRRHVVYVELYEWLLWAGLITFGLLLIYALFKFDFLFVIVTEVVGLAVMFWIRFIRFPPILTAYEQRLAKQRYFNRLRYQRPETTIRARPPRRRRRR